MANHKRPTHLKLFITRSVRVQKAHIAGAQAPQGTHDLMTIIERGTECTITFPEACDLVLADSAIEIKASNSEVLAEARALISSQQRETSAALDKPTVSTRKGAKVYE